MKDDMQAQINNLAIQLARVEEKMEAIENLLKSFIDSVKQGYVSQADFNKWVGDEFAPIKSNYQESYKLKWTVWGSLITAGISLAINFLRK